MASSFPGIGHIYDVIIVGAGISGTEAAFELAEAGLDVLILTTSLDTIYNLFIDRLSLKADKNSFMYEAFNEASVDNLLTSADMHRLAKYRLEHTQGIHLLQSSASKLIVEDSLVKGLETWEGVSRYGKYVVLAVGSFLKSRLKIGSLEETSGRLGEMSYDDLYQDLKSYLSFKDASFTVASNSDSLPYTVKCKIVTELSNFKTSVFSNLYATGFCSNAQLSYEETAVSGRQVACKILSKF